MSLDWLAGVIDGDGNISFNAYKRKSGTVGNHKQIRITTVDSNLRDKAVEIYRSIEINPYIFVERVESKLPAFRIDVTKPAHIHKLYPFLVDRLIAKKRQLEYLIKGIEASKVKDHQEVWRIGSIMKDLNSRNCERGSFDRAVLPTSEWIAGMLDTDGCIVVRKDRKWMMCRTSFHNVDKTIIGSVAKYMENIGIKYYMEHNDRNRQTRLYELKIYKTSDQCKFIKTVIKHLVRRRAKAELLLSTFDRSSETTCEVPKEVG